MRADRPPSLPSEASIIAEYAGVDTGQLPPAIPTSVVGCGAAGLGVRVDVRRLRCPSGEVVCGWAGRISVMTMVERLGFFAYLGGTADPVVTMRETVELFVAAEELGYDSVWVAQHHFGPTVGRLPAPLPFLAHVAARTRRVRLGTAV